MRNWVIACILPAVLLAAAPVGAAEEDIGGLIQALAADQEPARLKAIDALGALGAKGAEAVEALTKALSSDSPAMRAHAARALGKIGQPARGSVEALVRLVGDPEATVRREAARAIAAIRPGPKVTLPLLVKLLKDPDPAVKVRAMEAIAEHGEEAVAGLVQALADEKSAYWACLVLCELGAKAEPAVPGLIKLLDHAAPDVRQEAVLALAAVGEGAAPAAPRLVKALEDPLLQAPATYALVRIGKVPKEAQAKLRENAKGGDPMVKVVSMWALAKLRPRDKALVQEAVEAFVEGLKSDREQVRTAAARAISDIRPGPAVMVPLMEQALKGAEPETVRHALDALATLGAEAVPNLIQALKYEKARASVAYVLGEIGPKAAPATEALAGLLESSDPETRREAAVALAKIGPGAAEAVPALVKAMERCEGSAGCPMCFALGRIGPGAAAAKPVLVKALGSEDETLALFSAWALAHVDPEDAAVAKKSVPLLLVGLKDAESAIRLQAAKALGLLGPLAKGAVEALQEARNDRDEQVREAAGNALKAIGQ